jgi:hypothetical protein
MDYTRWLPTTVPDGFELHHIDIKQPEDYGINMSYMIIRYYPNTAVVTSDMLNTEVNDIPAIGVAVRLHSYYEDPYPQDRIDRVTRNGTSTKVLVEEKYGGHLVTIVSSPMGPEGKGYILHTNEYILEVGGRGLPLSEYEKIFLEILERQ